MKLESFQSLSGVLFLAAASVMTPAAADAASIDLSKYAYRHTSAQASRFDAIARGNALLAGSPMRAEIIDDYQSQTNPDADFAFGPQGTSSDIEGPNGEVWYYNMTAENEVVHYEYFNDYILQSFEVSIYDSTGRKVGTVKDKMHYESNEIRVPGYDVLPIVTQHYFNDDDKYEICIGLSINTDVPGKMHFRTLVYQLNGEKDADGNDKIIMTLPDLVADVITVPGEEEEVYMTVMTEAIEEDYPYDKDGQEETWLFRLRQHIALTTYGRVQPDGKLKELLTYKICYQNLPGDQESSPFMMTLLHNGKPYLAFSQYKETLFEPYYSIAEDVVQRTKNSLLIDVYTIEDGKAIAAQQTEIAFDKGDDSELIGSFFSVGDLRYKEDLFWGKDGNDDKISFFITRGDRIHGNGENLVYSYYIYGPDGKEQATIFTGAQSHLSLSDVKGFEPQQMFVSVEDGFYIFNMVDLYSAKLVAKFPYYLEIDDSDPDPMTTNLDRVARGNSYNYCVEMRYPIEDDDTSFMRWAWLDAKGEFLYFDEVNMGINVQYAQSYVVAAVLDPYLFYYDPNMEYMMLIKRGLDAGTQEELLIGQVRTAEHPNGWDVALFTPDEHGALKYIVPIIGYGDPMLTISRIGAGHYLEVFNLPFNMTGLAPELTATGALSINGDIITAAGAIEVFNLKGLKIAAGHDTLNIGSLDAGIYIVRGAGTIKKFIKK